MAGSTDVALEVGALGPLRCRVDGADIDLTRPQVRRLLAVLATRPDETVAVDDLIEALWPDDQPADPRAALRVVVSRLRSALGPAGDHIESSAEGIRLRLDDSDLIAFRALIDEADDLDDATEVADRLGRALGLWRDRPFVDVPGPLLLEEQARHLEERLWYARQRWVAAVQQLGDHDRVVRDAAGWNTAEPHRERLAVDLARSLAATGQKGTALDLLEATRRHLRDGFGVDPSDHLAAVEHEILTGAVQLGASPVHDDLGDETASPVVGRDPEIARLLENERTALVVGEPGIGKSTLLSAFITRAEADGRTVARVRADEALQRPLQPVAELIDALTDHDPSRTPPELRHRLFPSEPATPVSGAAPVTRESLVSRCADLVRELAPAATTTLVVDDAQWLDGLSADVIARLHVDTGTVQVLGCRPGSALEGMLDGADRIDLAPLVPADIEVLVTRLLPRARTEAVADRITERSGGNPLFARILIDMVAEGADALDHLPSSLLVAVQQRLEDLRGRTVRALEVAALMGTEFSLDVFAGLRPGDLGSLDEAAESGLLVVDERAGRVSFVHALVAEGIADLVAPARRIDLHDEIGTHLESGGADVTTYVDHYEAAATIDPTRAVTALVTAGEAFAEAFTWDVAAELFARAAAVQETQNRIVDALAARAAIGLGRAERILGRHESTAHLLAGARCARELDQQALMVEAIIELCSHGRTLEAGQVHDEAATLLDEALALELDDADRAELCATGSQLLSLSDQHARSRSLYLEAIELALAIDRPDVDVVVFSSAHLGLSHPDDFELRRVAADRLAALGEADADLAWEAAFLRFGTAMVAGDGPDMWQQLDELRTLTPKVRARPRGFGMAFCEAAAALIDGDLEAAERHMNDTLAEGQARYPESWVMMVYSSQLLAIRSAQGHLAELAEVTEGLLTENPDFPTWRVAAGISALESGNTSAARRHLAFLREDDFAGLIPDLTWTASIGFAGRMAAALDDRRSAEIVHELLLPHAGRMLWAGTCTYGPTDEVLAIIADFLGRPDEAADRRAAAADLVERLRRRA